MEWEKPWRCGVGDGWGAWFGVLVANDSLCVLGPVFVLSELQFSSEKVYSWSECGYTQLISPLSLLHGLWVLQALSGGR